MEASSTYEDVIPAYKPSSTVDNRAHCWSSVIIKNDKEDDINNWRQNHPELIVQDIGFITGVDLDLIRRILKFRGVNKWFRVRRLLISLKHRWKDEIERVQKEKAEARKKGDWQRYYFLKGYCEALIDCRQQVRALCHSPRDVDWPRTLKWREIKICQLPAEFPRRPHKRWFWRWDGLK